MKYFKVEPEVPGGWGDDIVVSDRSTHPPKISRLHIELDGWMGDGLMECFPVYFVTSQVAQALERSGVTGFSLDNMKVTKSELFDDMHPGRTLPPFYWLKVHGVPGREDFGVLARAELVLSEKAMMALKPFGLNHADIELYTGPMVPGASTAAVAGGFDPTRPAGVLRANAADLFRTAKDGSVNDAK